MPLTSADATELFRRPPDRMIDVGAGSAAYRRVGVGPDVLFVHGWPVSGATFRTLLPYLVDHVTCHVIDLPGAGSSSFGPQTPITLDRHITAVRGVVDALGLDDVAVVGHDSGGLIARHALAGDGRVRAMGLLDTEPSSGLGWRVRWLLRAGRLPGFGAVFGFVAGRPRLRRHPLALGGAFVDRSLLDGEFDELFLRPIREVAARRDAAARLVRSFDLAFVDDLAELHRRIDVPVQLVWGARDPFFPVEVAEAMVASFPDAHLTVVDNAALFAHEERPAEVAAALLPTLGSRC
jgi:haloalkane dehalogenase